MDPKWNEDQPIYRQLRDRVVAMILEGVLKDGDALPSVRNVAAEYRLNPLTVLKGYQELVDEGLVEKKRGRGMFVNEGARTQLLKDERHRFLLDHHLYDDVPVHSDTSDEQIRIFWALTHNVLLPYFQCFAVARPREVWSRIATDSTRQRHTFSLCMKKDMNPKSDSSQEWKLNKPCAETSFS